jgi:hypothetical protein
LVRLEAPFDLPDLSPKLPFQLDGPINPLINVRADFGLDHFGLDQGLGERVNARRLLAQNGAVFNRAAVCQPQLRKALSLEGFRRLENNLAGLKRERRRLVSSKNGSALNGRSRHF